jgi:integrase/recombinase XerD
MSWAARSVVPIVSSISKVITMTALRQQMENDMDLRGMAVRTRQSYIEAVRGLAKFYRRRPDAISVEEVQGYLLHLLQERRLSYSTCNLVTNGLRFFYRITLGQNETEFCLPRPRVPQRLPEILSREEIERLLAVTTNRTGRSPAFMRYRTNLKHRVLLMTTYSAGLRVSEVARLKVSDIDSQRMTLRVDQGKGAKDRYTLLSKRLLSELRRYWQAYRPREWLFPLRDGRGPIDPRSAQKIYYHAKEKAGIRKRCGIHGLRHAFATHLLEAGVDLHRIQRLLGHGHITTTMRYFHLAQRHLESTASPLDLLTLPQKTGA